MKSCSSSVPVRLLSRSLSIRMSTTSGIAPVGTSSSFTLMVFIQYGFRRQTYNGSKWHFPLWACMWQFLKEVVSFCKFGYGLSCFRSCRNFLMETRKWFRKLWGGIRECLGRHWGAMRNFWEQLKSYICQYLSRQYYYNDNSIWFKNKRIAHPAKNAVKTISIIARCRYFYYQ